MAAVAEWELTFPPGVFYPFHIFILTLAHIIAKACLICIFFV